MTAFTAANIPSTVNTIEELFTWCGAILAELNPTSTVITGPGQASRAANLQTVFLEGQAVNPERCAVLVYVPLVPGWRGQGKLYSNGVAEMSANPIPTHYTAA
jgi:hypothetical protein